MVKNTEEKILLTKAGLKNLKDELDQLVNVDRKEIVKRIKQAIAFGDLSENSEYEDAKNEQAFIEGKIAALEAKIKNAHIISDKEKNKGGVQLGSTVVIHSSRSKKEITVTIVGSTEVDPLNGKISNESPIGKALLGANKGDTVEADVPEGKGRYKIVKIS